MEIGVLDLLDNEASRLVCWASNGTNCKSCSDSKRVMHLKPRVEPIQDDLFKTARERVEGNSARVDQVR